MDWLNWFGKPSATPGGPTDYSMILPALLPTAVTLAAGLFQQDPQMAYGNTEAGFNAQMAFNQQELAQSKELALAQIAASAANARSGAGSAAAAASIAAKASRENTTDTLTGETYFNRAKLAADRLALKIAAKRGDPAVLQSASENIIQALAARAAAAEGGFANSANFLAQFKS